MSGMKADPNAVHKHGQQLTGEITEALQKAHEAATEVKVEEESMGVLCAQWAQLFDEELAAARQMLQQLPKAVDASGSRVLDSAKEMRERDEYGKGQVEGTVR